MRLTIALAVGTAVPLLGLSLAVAQKAPAAAAVAKSSSPALPYAMVKKTLKNGLRVILVRTETPGLMAYYTLVRTGSRNEVESGHTGFAHFFEHMMFRGTKRYSEDQRNAIFKKLGVDTNAFTADDMTVYTYYGPNRGLSTIIDLEADRFQHLKYSEHDFKTEAKAVLGEYNKSFSNPVRKMEETLLDLAFSKHTYKHTTMGFLEDIKAMPTRYEYSLKFFDRFYRPDNCTIFVVGDIDTGKVMADLEKHYGPWKGRSRLPRVLKEPPQLKERTFELKWSQPTLPRVMVGYHTPSLGSGVPGLSGYKAAAIQNVLGPLLFGKSSPLYKELVLSRQTVESMDPQYWDHRDPHLFYYVVTVKDEAKVAETRAQIDQAIAELAQGKLDPARLDEVKSNLRYGLSMSLETPEQIAEQLAVLTSAVGDPETLNLLYDQITKITVKDVTQFAKRYLTTKNRTVVVLKPPASTAQAGSNAKRGAK